MDTIDRSALVHYTPQEMFALVSDVEAYPQFLPWCTGAEILSQAGDASHLPLMQAVLEGPFSQLHGRWRFDPLGEEGCKVSLFLEYDFSSRMVSLVVGPVFNKIANSLVDAFQKRAVEVYGAR